MTNWVTTGVSIKGKSHTETNLPCQDSFDIQKRDNWVVAVVSDGAGTAKYADKGSEFVSEFFSNSLISLSKEIDKNGPGSWVNDYVIQSITEIRSNFRKMANSDRLNDYHATLVAILLGDNGGFLIHIGDGAIFGGIAKSIGETTNLSDQPFISLPENGEYANETFFITENSWIKHLRITPIPPVDWVCLGTDGGMSLAMEDEKEVKKGFIAPLLKILVNAEKEKVRTQKLEGILNDPEADKLTSDDKTLCILFKDSLKKLTDNFEYIKKDSKKGSSIKSMPQKNELSNEVISELKEENNLKRKIWKDKKNFNLKKIFMIILVFSLLVAVAFFYNESKKNKEMVKTQADALENQHHNINQSKETEKDKEVEEDDSENKEVEEDDSEDKITIN